MTTFEGLEFKKAKDLRLLAQAAASTTKRGFSKALCEFLSIREEEKI